MDLGAEYVRRGIDVTVVLPEPELFDSVGLRLRNAGVRVIRLNTDGRNGYRQQLDRWLTLVRVMRRAHPDVVHVHTGGATGGLEPIATARLLTSATVVLTEHDVPVERPDWRLQLTKALTDSCAHAVVAVSRRNAAIRAARVGAHTRRRAAVLNGVPIPPEPRSMRTANRQRVRHELGLAEQAVVLGSVVRLAPGKGLHDLLQAFALVCAAQSCELLLVGDGPLRAELARLAKDLGIAARVHFAGHYADPAPVMDAMDAFILAVPAGSMSIALLEAMAAGLPPVITFCGPEEAVVPEQTGLSAPPEDPTGLSEVLSRIVADPSLRARLGQAAADHVQRHFSVRRVADDLLELYAAARLGEIPRRLRTTAASA